MIRTLVLIAVAGFFTAAICFAAAASFGGPELFSHSWGWRHWTERDEPASERPWREDVRAPASAELAWAGESLDIEIAAEVRFTQAPGEPRMVVTGPRRLVEALRLENGRLVGRSGESGRLEISITAPRITEFRLDGEDTLIIEGYDQDRLTLDVRGRADVTARGRVGALTLNIAETADADLSGLDAEDVLANVRDYGEATLAPRERAHLKVADSGKVTLSRRPAQLSSDVTDRGKVIQAGEAAPAGAGARDATS